MVLAFVLARLFNIAFALAFVGGCGVYGVKGLKDRVTWDVPETAPCELSSFTGKRWVHVEGCEFVPGIAVSESLVSRGGTQRVTGAWVAIRPNDSVDMLPVVVNLQDEALLALYKKELGKPDTRDLETPVKLAPFIAEASDDARVSVRIEFPDNAIFFEQMVDGQKPPLLWPLVCTLAAIFWLMVLIAAIFVKDEEEPEGSSPKPQS